MESSKPKVTRKAVLLPIIGLVSFFLYIYLFNVDIPAIIATAQRADLLFYSLAILVSLVEVFFYAVSWRTLLNCLKVKISVVKSTLFVWYGLFMDIIVPAESVSGEVSRVYLVTREQSGTSGKVAASLVLHRLLGIGINVAVLVLGIGLFFKETHINPALFNLILFFTVAIAVILLLFIVFAFRENLSLKVINALMRVGDFITLRKWKLLSRLKEEVYKSMKMFHDSMQEYKRQPKAVATSLLLLAVNWACSLCIPYLVFLSLGFLAPWSAILITSAIVVAVKSIPLGIPFEVGLPEITLTTLFVGLGIPADVSATATILSRIITLWLRFFIGFIVQQWIELKPIVILTGSPTKEKA